MRFFKLIIFLFSLSIVAQNKFVTPFEKGNGNQSTTYEECILFYETLDEAYSTIKMVQKGTTDSGKPLYLVVYSNDGQFDYDDKNLNKKAVILINNGIHPGEPDGIDASMLLMRDLAMGKIKTAKNTFIAVIPVYNVGGMLNRNSHSRANQNGPEEYGFRGNGRNYDLNRDFIKSDTKNSRSFQQLFTELKPDLFLDNHVSNGADYQYTFTCIATQHERLGNKLGNFFINDLYPTIVKDMQQKKIDVVPYVNVHSTTPDNGFEQFTDTPRYATGYTTLFHTLGFVPETHMLKAYSERVKVTYEFMISSIKYADTNVKKIKQMRLDAMKDFQPGMNYPLDWTIDSTKVSYIDFKRFKGDYKASEISGKDRLYYDRSKPFTKKISFYGDYKPSKSITIPSAYIIPHSQWQVLDLLQLNGINYAQLQKDTIIEVESYKIESYKTSNSAYEGHYSHYNTKISKSIQKVKFYSGDYVFSTNQTSVKYLIETLEPEAVDSYFNWNFFDTILQRKEGYSAYVFEDLAKEFLNENPEVKKEFEKKKLEDKAFAENAYEQLDWVYRQSPYYEKAYLQYPVYRIK
ncbi:M14 family zinc carboxypeptidase [Flavobacterium psychraquaticum]|uniref:M14 family zinc carboxypeptidase n=1 Tax=Flavobacterium psychraquaticum TaxID=3103958 RepID=UPI002ACD29A5|nr:M14 family zinc carboxypeptidase [Flavobacterium sp. LB-N7T]